MALHHVKKEKIIKSNWVNLMEIEEEEIQKILQNYTGSYFYVYDEEGQYLFLIDAPLEFTNEEEKIVSFPEAGLYVMCNPDESADYHNFTFEKPKVEINSNYKQYFLPEPPINAGIHTLKADEEGNIYWA